MERDETEGITAGTIIGPYGIVRVLPRGGGMARVFLVEVREKYRQPGLPRYLALKVARAEYQNALLAEADFLSHFDHPNVVRIYPLPLPQARRQVYAAREEFPFGWGWYYAMEYISGGSLHQRLTRSTTLNRRRGASVGEGRRLPIAEALRYARHILAGLTHIHERSIVNLDIKPGNILFRRPRGLGGDPQAVICDFGIARDLRYPRSGLLGVATPEYVSPEQALESDKRRPLVDVRSDIFSLGIVIYEMLTGHLPFGSPVEIVDRSSRPLPPSELRRGIPSSLEEIVLRALSKDPAGRFQSAAEMKAALDQVPMPLNWPAIVRNTVLVGGLAAAGVGAVLAWPHLFPPAPPRTPTPPVTARPATPTATRPRVTAAATTPVTPRVTPAVTTLAAPAATVTPTTAAPGKPTITLRPTNTPPPTVVPTLTPTNTRLPTRTPTATATPSPTVTNKPTRTKSPGPQAGPECPEGDWP